MLAQVLTPLVGQSPHHIINSGDFVNKIRDLEIPPGRKMISYDVSALFTSIPVEEALAAVSERLEGDQTLGDRTPLSKSQVLELLAFCLNTTYFAYKGTIYTQTHGAAMGSPVSPIVANLYMERFEQRAITTAPIPPENWYRYVDDTFVVIHEYAVEGFTNHLNSLDPNIKFTTEAETDGCLPFLDTKIHLLDDASTKVSIYRKPTHTDQYLQFDSNHHLEHKRSVVRTLTNRATSLVTCPADRQAEVNHVQSALRANGYPSWMFKLPTRRTTSVSNKDKQEQSKHRSVALPYIGGLSEKLTNIFRQHGVSTYHKPINTIRSLLVHPKDPITPGKKCGVVYKITCPECHEEYIGETGRALATRMKDHLSNRAPLTAVGEHRAQHQHGIQASDVAIIAREQQLWPRKIRESIEIRASSPTLNRDTGYELPAIYNRLLSHDRPSGGHVT